MTDDVPPDLSLRDRFLRGTCTPEDLARIRRWSKEHPDHWEGLALLKEGFEERRNVPASAWQEAWGRWEEKTVRGRSSAHERELGVTGEKTARPVNQTRERRTAGLGRYTLRRWAWIGGVTALILCILLLTPKAPVLHLDATRMYATTAQQQAIINLGDGSRVTLAPQTALRLQQAGMQSRVLILDRGEAYFEVAHAAGFPFIVRSGAVTAQVLGTAFLVQHAADDAHVRVAVTDGKVRVTTAARTGTRAGTRASGLTLTMGQVIDVTDSTTHVGTADDLTPGTEWAPGRVIFRDTPLVTVLQTVSQWYGYHFRYADSTLRTRNVTMVVSTRSSAEALAEIEDVLVVNLAVVGDTVTLVPHAPNSRRSAPRTRTYDVWTPTREVGR